MFAVLSILAFLSIASSALASSSVLFALDNVEATVYYDVSETATNDICSFQNGGPFPAGWAEDTINMGITECQSLMANSLATLADLGTNRIVAIDHTMIANDPAYWCGRELVVYDSSGQQITFAEGSFIVWDGCAAAMTKNIVDMSALAFTQINGGTCGGNNPTGLRYEILDNYIWTPNGASSASAPASESSTQAASTPATTSTATHSKSKASASKSSTYVAPTQSSSKLSASKAASTSAVQTKSKSSYSVHVDAAVLPATSASTFSSAESSSAASASVSISSDSVPSSSSTVSASSQVETSPSPSDTTPENTSIPTVVSALTSPAATSSAGLTSSCKFGAWQCDGLELQVCSYDGTSSLNWETIEQCNSICQVTASGSVDCE